MGRSVSMALVLLISLVGASDVPALELKITDSKGKVVELRNAFIDYTGGFGLVQIDHETAGIRILQGDGEITVAWEKIDSVRVRGEKEHKTSKGELAGYKIDAEIRLKNGTAMPVNLAYGRIVGETELGQFTIRVMDARTILLLKKE